MELKRRFNLETIFGFALCAFLLSWVAIGLQPAEAANVGAVNFLEIPSIGLQTDVVGSELENSKISVPDETVGSFSKFENKTLLLGHSTTVFWNLNKINLRDEIYYNNKKYIVTKIQTLLKRDVKMNRLVGNSERGTLVLMTCAGELLDDGDATKRLIVTAIISEV